MPGQFQSLGIDKVDVCGGDGEDDTARELETNLRSGQWDAPVRVADIFDYEVANLLLNVAWLVAYRNLPAH